MKLARRVSRSPQNIIPSFAPIYRVSVTQLCPQSTQQKIEGHGKRKRVHSIPGIPQARVTRSTTDGLSPTGPPFNAPSATKAGGGSPRKLLSLPATRSCSSRSHPNHTDHCNMFGSLFGLRNSWLDAGAVGFFGCDRFSTACALNSLWQGNTPNGRER